MKTTSLSAFFCLFLLAACMSAEQENNLRYVDATYGKTVYQEYKDDKDAWRIFDRPDLGKMGVSLSLDKTIALGKNYGGNWPGKADFRSAAEGFLKQAHRNCLVTADKTLSPTGYEFSYACK
ncbi:MAG: hypothetical protein H3C49_11745 [Alphaproteobacteria bacterium]|nr:hypothetical protein [Alphaproteobacteria bacterium]